jgi:hypothetical protein
LNIYDIHMLKILCVWELSFSWWYQDYSRLRYDAA